MLKRWAVVGVCFAGACTAPDYKFAAPDAGGTAIATNDAAPPIVDAGLDGGGIVDAGVDAAPIAFAPIVVPATANFAADCAAFPASSVTPAAVSDGTKQHCFVFFFNDPWGRRWNDAEFACSQITYQGKPARLATFPTQTLANNVQAAYTVSLVPWIGLALTPAGDPSTKAGFQWLNGDAFNYDGWVTGHPAGQACVAWAGASQWSDFDCAKVKGFLCEIDP